MPALTVTLAASERTWLVPHPVASSADAKRANRTPASEPAGRGESAPPAAGRPARTFRRLRPSAVPARPAPAGTASPPRQVTLRELGAAPPSAAASRQAAERGLRGSASQFPFAGQVQAAFGRHDISGIAAHTGAAAAASAREIGASAYTVGDRVAFGSVPDLRTAAHEAAHVVQQRAGIRVPGGMGQAGDRFERDAVAVADRVAAGLSAEAVLDRGVAAAPRQSASLAPAAGDGALQRRDVHVYRGEDNEGLGKIAGQVLIAVDLAVSRCCAIRGSRPCRISSRQTDTSGPGSQRMTRTPLTR